MRNRNEVLVSHDEIKIQEDYASKIRLLFENRGKKPVAAIHTSAVSKTRTTRSG